MVSKALDRSRKKLIGTSFLSVWVMILSTSSNAAYYVECFGLKRYRLSKISLFSLKYVDNWVKIIFSTTLDIVDSTEIRL